MRKPYFVQRLKCWYYKDATARPIRLDPDEDEAYRLWEHYRQVAKVGTTDDVTFAALAEAWLEEHRKMPTEKFPQQASYVARFALAMGDKKALEVSQGDLIAWLAKPKPGRIKKVDGKELEGPPIKWARSTQADAASAVRRVYRWAVGKRKLSWNPLDLTRIPQGESRLVIITPEEHRALVLAARKHNAPFAMYLIASRCGARPKQIRTLTAANVHYDADGRMFWVFDEHKSAKKTRKPLVVYCYPCLATITKILMSSRKNLLFLNENGHQWKKDSVARAMRRVRKRAKVSEKITVYAYRHSFATDALVAGNSLAIVAELLGHVDTRMVGRVYGHLDQHKGHLIDAVSKMQQKRLG